MPGPLEMVLDPRTRQNRNPLDLILKPTPPNEMTDEQRRALLIGDMIDPPSPRPAPEFGPARPAPRMVEVAGEVQRRSPLPNDEPGENPRAAMILRGIGAPLDIAAAAAPFAPAAVADVPRRVADVADRAARAVPAVEWGGGRTADDPAHDVAPAMSPAARRALLGGDIGTDKPAAPPPPPRDTVDAVLGSRPAPAWAANVSPQALAAILGTAGASAPPRPVIQSPDRDPDAIEFDKSLRAAAGGIGGRAVVPGAPAGTTWSTVTKNTKGGYLDSAYADDYRQNPDGSYTHLGRRLIADPTPPQGTVPFGSNPYNGGGDNSPLGMAQRAVGLGTIVSDPVLQDQLNARRAALIGDLSSRFAAPQTATADRQAALDRMMLGIDASAKEGAANRAAEMDRAKLPFSAEARQSQTEAAIAADAIARGSTPAQVAEAVANYRRSLGAAGTPAPGAAGQPASPVPDPVGLLLGEVRSLIPAPGVGETVTEYKPGKAAEVLDRFAGVSLTEDQRQELLRRMFLTTRDRDGRESGPVVRNPQAFADAVTRAAVNAATNRYEIGSRGTPGELPGRLAIAGTPIELQMDPDQSRTLTGLRYLASGFDRGTAYRQAKVGDRVVPLDAGDLSKGYWWADDADRQQWDRRLTAADWLLRSLAKIGGPPQ